MGIFSMLAKNANDDVVNETERILRTHYSSDARELLNKFLYYKNNPDGRIIEPFSLYATVLNILITSSAVAPERYSDMMSYGEKVYSKMFPYEEKTPGFEELSTIYMEMYNKDGIISRKIFDENIYDLFGDKFNFMKWAKNITVYTGDGLIESFIKPYAVEARGYFLDEDCFTANIIDVSRKLQNNADRQAVYDDEIEKLHRMSGIYDVNEAALLDAVRKIQMAQVLHDRVVELVKVVEERVNILDSTSRSSVREVKTLCEDEVKKAKYELGIIDDKLKKAYDDCVAEQKQVVLYEKKKLIDDTFAEAEERLSALKKAAEKVINTVKLEMPEGITQVELTGVQRTADIRVPAPATEKQVVSGVAPRQSVVYSDYVSTAADYIGKNGDYAKVYDVQPAAPDNDIEIPEIKPLLDEEKKFTERYQEAMDKKAYMIAMGEHFHYMFDDVLTAVMENANPYLIGPSGCGKTYMVSQIARILDMDYIDIGYINEEYDILGFCTADGGYSRPNFYRCYKYGKIAFCDELDNGNSRATVKLNSFLSNLMDASYNFPNGENVKRHPNFRIIGAGNTDGNGADSNYNSREKIEESVQQRFTPIYIGYDNEVEKRILVDYPDWYSFLVLFRKATDEWSRKNYGDAPGIITTRDATRIKKYLDNKSFDMNKILDYEFIQTKDITYLAFIEDYMKQILKDHGNAMDIFRAFSEKIDLKRG
ncbi:MAG: AAA family ATPase [Eubacterium sp.]|nr:AAA family ATPase [Eubacterium sp.]